MPKGFQKGDPRAVAAGRKGGSKRPRKQLRTEEYMLGYNAGWHAAKRAALARGWGSIAEDPNG